MLRNIKETVSMLPHPTISSLPTPPYTRGAIDYQYDSRRRVGLAVESMRCHMTDEGWQIFDGLQRSGYILAGHNLPVNVCNVKIIVDDLNPSTVVLQDKREWDVKERDFRDQLARFHDVQHLKRRDDVFKLTILKDSHQNPSYHRESADEIGCHAWIIYYNPRIVYHLAPYIRPQHLIRTYHTIDSLQVPPYSHNHRNGILISGAISGVYPLRTEIIRAHTQSRFPELTYLKHPGYHRNGTNTPQFLQTLSKFKISICTSSIFGYSLRKIIESTACGCTVITDLPTDEKLPHIDGNLVRVPHDITPDAVRSLCFNLLHSYDSDKQAHYSLLARKYYDFRVVTKKLADDIETLRINYNTISDNPS